MSEQDQFDPTPEQQAAIEDLADKRGISTEMARRAFFGARVEPEGPVAAPKGPHKRHPTGHVYDYESDRDHELAEERAAYQPLSDEQRGINARGRALLQPLRDKLEIDNAIRHVEEAHAHPDPYYLDKDAESKQRELNAQMRAIHDRRQKRTG